MIADFAMIITQMQSQAAHPDVLLTITSTIGLLERSASFHDGTWHGYDLTHNLIDRRSHQTYAEPTRPPLDQKRSLTVSPATTQPMTHNLLPPLEQSRFNCTLPEVPPQIFTLPMPLAFEGIRFLTQPPSNFMLASAFQGEVHVNGTANDTSRNESQVRQLTVQKDRPARTVTFQDS